ncbi:MAG: methyltransferase domain-containing protein [Candidatus Margulisiibacteriota bacterium]
MNRKLYTDGSYLKNNPTWHLEDSEWKANNILRMIEKNKLAPKTICEIGCGAGEILVQLKDKMDKKITFCGYEISPQAFHMCKERQGDRIIYKNEDILEETEAFFDLILLIDLIEHMEDYYNFLRKIRHKGHYKILHIPLDLSSQAILRSKPLERSRERAGHLHFFTKEIAIQILKDVGYEAIDYFYTAGAIERPAKSLISLLFKLPRKLLFGINKEFAARLLGGYSILVLAK